MVFPKTGNWDDFLLFFYDFVVDFDSFGGLLPLNHYVESPEQIRFKFDVATYYKGAVILRMLKDSIGEEVFVQGVKYYLDEMQFQSATPEDLFNNLQKAIDEANPGNSVKINEFMQSYTNLPGIPVVTVSRSENGLLLTQSSVGSNSDELFGIPISFTTASDSNFDDVVAEFWMTTKEHEVTQETVGKTWTDDDWIIFNLRDTGYYLTNYDDTLWDLIISSLVNDHEKIHHLNRGTLFADTFRFIEQAMDFRATVFLEMMDSLKIEFHPHVWRRANAGMRVFERRLWGTETHTMFMNFLNDLMSGIYGRSFENDGFAQLIVDHYSCISGVQECNENAVQGLIDIMDESNPRFPPHLRCNAYRAANETIWMHFFDDAMTRSSSTLQAEALRNLECNQNPALIQKLLDVALDFENTLSSFHRENLLQSVAVDNLVGYNAVIDLVEKHHEVINEK
jgi:aminopeptidase N